MSSFAANQNTGKGKLNELRGLILQVRISSNYLIQVVDVYYTAYFSLTGLYLQTYYHTHNKLFSVWPPFCG